MDSMNIIVAGVGGQGILSIAFVLDNVALKEGFHFKQAEVHGMSQRGGAVQSHIRFSRQEIFSDLIPEGAVDLILSVEPLEALRYYHFLKPEGTVVTSQSPFVNIPNYPECEGIYNRVSTLQRHVLVDSEGLARLAGSVKAQNMVMLGAASYLFPFEEENCRKFVDLLFKAKGDKAMKINQDAFTFGAAMSAFYRDGLDAGLNHDQIRPLCEHLDPNLLEPASLAVWKKTLDKKPGLFTENGWEAGKRVPGTVEEAGKYA